MKLSTRSRYGTRLMADLAEHFNDGPVQLGQIARRLDVSIKYLEQLVIPLKKANLAKSVRGPKGGHMLTMSPEEITIGGIVEVLENGMNLTHCIENPKICDRHKSCRTRDVWKMASEAMISKLHSVKLIEVI